MIIMGNGGIYPMVISHRYGKWMNMAQKIHDLPIENGDVPIVFCMFAGGSPSNTAHHYGGRHRDRVGHIKPAMSCDIC